MIEEKEIEKLAYNLGRLHDDDFETLSKQYLERYGKEFHHQIIEHLSWLNHVDFKYDLGIWDTREKREDDVLISAIERITPRIGIESAESLLSAINQKNEAYCVVTKPMEVPSEDEAPWEYTSDFWDDGLETLFAAGGHSFKYRANSVEVQKIGDGMIVLKYSVMQKGEKNERRI